MRGCSLALSCALLHRKSGLYWPPPCYGRRRRAGAQCICGAASLVAGPVKWTERWIARAQRKADLRAERFLWHEEGVRAGTEPPSFRERMESSGTLNRGPFTRRYLNSDWALDARPDDASLRWANEWLTWVGGADMRACRCRGHHLGPVRGRGPAVPLHARRSGV